MTHTKTLNYLRIDGSKLPEGASAAGQHLQHGGLSGFTLHAGNVASAAALCLTPVRHLATGHALPRCQTTVFISSFLQDAALQFAPMAVKSSPAVSPSPKSSRAAPASPPAYSESSSRVLKGLEPVKQRPGMYTRTDNPLHIIQEVLDNAADESLAGHGKKIKVTLHADGSVSVDDDGRGIPFAMHPEETAPVIELVFTQLHAGGKFDKGKGGAYSFSGGLHGVGVSVTNALAKRLEVTSYREGSVAHLVFANGDVLEPLVVRKAGEIIPEVLGPVEPGKAPPTAHRSGGADDAQADADSPVVGDAHRYAGIIAFEDVIEELVGEVREATAK